jgi:hypothetical protein
VEWSEAVLSGMGWLVTGAGWFWAAEVGLLSIVFAGTAW